MSAEKKYGILRSLPIEENHHYNVHMARLQQLFFELIHLVAFALDSLNDR